MKLVIVTVVDYYKKDIIKALSEECKKQGLQFYVYYSQLDWHHEDYFPRGRTGIYTERPEKVIGIHTWPIKMLK